MGPSTRHQSGIIEDIAPSLKYCTDQEFYELMDYVFSIPQVQEFITEQQKTTPVRTEYRHNRRSLKFSGCLFA